MSSAKQFLLSFLICLVAFGALSYLITGAVNDRFFSGNADIEKPANDGKTEQNPSTEDKNEIPTDLSGGFTALIIGKDPTTSDTDALILCRVDKKTKKMSVCSIPTETRYLVTGTDSNGKRYEGSLSFKETVKTYGIDYLQKKLYALTDQKIDYYAQINLSSARTIIGELGGTKGVLYTVPEAMDYEEDEKDGNGIHLKEGAQYLSGTKAVELLRYRTYKSGTSDTKRCTTQVDFIRKLVSETLSLDNPFYTKLLTDAERKRLLNLVTTNVTGEDIVHNLDLVFTLKDYEFVSIPFRYGDTIRPENVGTIHDTFNDPFRD